jgi:hypothetical protein
MRLAILVTLPVEVCKRIDGIQPFNINKDLTRRCSGHTTQVQNVVDRVRNTGNKFDINERGVNCIGHLFTMSLISHCLGSR